MSINKKLALTSLTILSSISLTTQAQNTLDKQIFVAPKCLTQQLQVDYQTLASTSQLTLIETNKAGLHALIHAKQDRQRICGGFIDVTDSWNAYRAKTPTSDRAATFLSSYETPPKPALKRAQSNYHIQYQQEVNRLIGQLNPQNIWANLTAFTATSSDQFPDRYANSETGVKAAMWLKNKIETLASEQNRTDITAYTVNTGTKYKQPSVVVKIGQGNEPGIVLGAHMDTLSKSFSGVKPGADDDGSGSMTLLEVASTLITSDLRFKKPIYIIWYAAEEMGLVGSGYVVKDFQAKQIPVTAALHFDMTGYAYKNDPTIWLIEDNVNKELTMYLESLIKTYVKKPINRTRCGYACSDHASWDKAGVKAAFPFEAKFGQDNPYIHSSNDKINVLSLDHMTDFAKLGIGFAVELAEPIV
jgi:leucyl aminopeptidase